MRYSRREGIYAQKHGDGFRLFFCQVAILELVAETREKFVRSSIASHLGWGSTEITAKVDIPEVDIAIGNVGAPMSVDGIIHASPE